MAREVIGTKDVKQGRRGTRAFLILAVGVALALVAFTAFMVWRPQPMGPTGEQPTSSTPKAP